jgi:hypothetical protein
MSCSSAATLSHANIKMTERYAKLARAHITKTGNTAKLIWTMLDKRSPQGESSDEKPPQGEAGKQIAHPA